MHNNCIGIYYVANFEIVARKLLAVGYVKAISYYGISVPSSFRVIRLAQECCLLSAINYRVDNK